MKTAQEWIMEFPGNSILNEKNIQEIQYDAWQDCKKEILNMLRCLCRGDLYQNSPDSTYCIEKIKDIKLRFRGLK